MILHADGEDIAEHWTIVVLHGPRVIRCAGCVEILKDQLAWAIFLESDKVDMKFRLVGWCECGEVESVVWWAAGVYH